MINTVLVGQLESVHIQKLSACHWRPTLAALPRINVVQRCSTKQSSSPSSPYSVTLPLPKGNRTGKNLHDLNGVLWPVYHFLLEEDGLSNKRTFCWVAVGSKLLFSLDTMYKKENQTWLFWVRNTNRWWRRIIVVILYWKSRYNEPELRAKDFWLILTLRLLENEFLSPLFEIGTSQGSSNNLKESGCNAGDLVRSLGQGRSNSRKYNNLIILTIIHTLKNPLDREA